MSLLEIVSDNHGLSSSSFGSHHRDDSTSSNKIPNFSPPQIEEKESRPFSFTGSGSGGGTSGTGHGSTGSTAGDSLDVRTKTVFSFFGGILLFARHRHSPPTNYDRMNSAICI